MPTYSGQDPDAAPAGQDINEAGGAGLTSSWITNRIAHTIEHGPTAELYGMGELAAAKSNVVTVPDEFGGMTLIGDKPTLDIPMDEAKRRVKDAGLDSVIKDLGDGPTIKAPALDIMINRAQRDQQREARIAEGPKGFIAGAFDVGTGFLAGAADPLNLAASMIPVIGEARYGKMLAGAEGNLFRRAGVRAVYGGAQGAAFSTVMTPLDWASQTQEGRDYGLSDALHSILYGVGQFGLMHVAGGAGSDIYRAYKGRPLYPYGPGEPMEAKSGQGSPAPAPPTSGEAPRPSASGAPQAPSARAQAPERATAPGEARAPSARAGSIPDAAVLEQPRVKQRLDNLKIDSDHDVPYGAGADVNDPNLIHVDQHVPAETTIEGVTFDPRQAVARHEIPEHDGMEQEGMSYPQAHATRGEAGERAYVENIARENGKSPASFWQKYTDQWDGWLSHIEHENPVNPPAGLYTKPYPHKEAELLASRERTEGRSVPSASSEPAPFFGPGDLDHNLPPRANEDLMRASIAAMSEGKPINAEAILRASTSDPRIAEAMRIYDKFSPATQEGRDRKAIFDDVHAQAIAAGYDEKASQEAAAVIAAEFVQRAARRGGQASAADLYRDENLQIEPWHPGGAGYNQGAPSMLGVHQTREDFASFDRNRFQQRDAGFWGNGVYMFPRDYIDHFRRNGNDYTFDYAGWRGSGDARSMLLSLGTQKPFHIMTHRDAADFTGSSDFNDLAQHGYPYGKPPIKAWQENPELNTAEGRKAVSSQFTKALLDAGYDSVLIHTEGHPDIPYEMVAIKPDTLRGTFTGQTYFQGANLNERAAWSDAMATVDDLRTHANKTLDRIIPDLQEGKPALARLNVVAQDLRSIARTRKIEGRADLSPADQSVVQALKSADAVKTAIAAASPESIDSAAYRYKGKVYTGRIHSDAFKKIEEEHPEKSADEIYEEILSNEGGNVHNMAGFETSTGRYIDRNEAHQLTRFGEATRAVGQKLDEHNIERIVPEAQGAFRAADRQRAVETAIENLKSALSAMHAEVDKIYGEHPMGFAEGDSPSYRSPYVDLGHFEHDADGPLGKQAQDYILFRGLMTGNEHILAFDDDGNVLAHGHGGSNNVSFSPELAAATRDPENRVIVHHNHPSGFSLSPPDIGFLSRPGLRTIWAHGHGGQVARAELTLQARTAALRYWRLSDKDSVMRVALNAAASLLKPFQEAITARKISYEQAITAHADAVAMALDRAKIIEYRSNHDHAATIDAADLEPHIQAAADEAARSFFREPDRTGARQFDRRTEPLRKLGDLGASFERTRAIAGEHLRPQADEGLRAGDHRGEAEGSIGFREDEPFPRPSAPTFFSAVSRAVDQIKQPKASPDQWLATIKNASGVKAEEMQWLGLADWLKEQKGSVTKEQVQDYIRANQIEVREVHKGDSAPLRPDLDRQIASLEAELSAIGREVGEHPVGSTENADAVDRMNSIHDRIAELEAEKSADGGAAKFRQYTLPGGENYRELLLTLPEKPSTFDGSKVEIKRHLQSITQGKTSIWYEGQKVAQYSDDPELKPGGSYEQKPDAYWMETARRLHDRGDWINKIPQRGNTFRTSHWDEPNVLAHIRFDDRIIDGKKTLHIAEIQSDWHQKGRKEGYREQHPTEEEITQHAADLARDSGFDWGQMSQQERGVFRGRSIDELSQSHKVPDAPFKTTWPELSMKRMLRYASEHGYEKISWDTGETNAERYDLSKHIDTIDAWKSPDGDGTYRALALKGGNDVYSKRGMTEQELADTFGKDVADRIVEKTKEGKPVRLEGLDLKVGGEGMLGFYDDILPAAVSKLVKKFGGKVSDSVLDVVKLGNDDFPYEIVEPNGRIWQRTRTREQAEGELADRPPGFLSLRVNEGLLASRTEKTHVHSLTITPSLRQAAVEQGFPLFQSRGTQPNARITMTDAQTLVELFKRADRSSLIHEGSHMFLKHLLDDSTLETAMSSLKQDADLAAQWLGFDNAAAMRDQFSQDPQGPRTIAAHEQWARGFETYLAEGKAPSIALMRAFEKFKQWMLEIYHALVHIGAPIDDRIRGVFDRMLASDEEIKQAQAVREGNTQAAAWHAIATQQAPEDPNLVEAMHEAKAAADLAGLDPKQRITIAQKEMLETEAQFQAMLAYEDPEIAAHFNTQLAALDGDEASRLDMIKAGAECLAFSV